MTWWAEHGNQIGGAAAGLVVAGLVAATRYLSAITNRPFIEDAKVPAGSAGSAVPNVPTVQPVQAVPAVPARALSVSDELDAAHSSLRRARMEVDDLHAALRSTRQRHEDELRDVRQRLEEDLRRQRVALDERDNELARMATAIVEERTRTASLATELEELRRQVIGADHGSHTRAAKPAVPSRSGTDHRGVRGLPGLGKAPGTASPKASR